jgi:hypothetical protein
VAPSTRQTPPLTHVCPASTMDHHSNSSSALDPKSQLQPFHIATPPQPPPIVEDWMGERTCQQFDGRTIPATDSYNLLRTIHDIIVDQEKRRVPPLLRSLTFGSKDKGFVVLDKEMFEEVAR